MHALLTLLGGLSSVIPLVWLLRQRSYPDALLGTAYLLFAVAPALPRCAWRWWLWRGACAPAPRPPPPSLRIAMVTTYVPKHEPFSLLKNTLEAMAQVTYPHDTYVLDEGAEPRVRHLCRQLSQRYGVSVQAFTRSDQSVRQKGANITAWLEKHGYVAYDAAVFLDLDHRPYPDYLDHVLGYLGAQCMRNSARDRTRGRVVFVQTPAVYRNAYEPGASLITKGAEQMRQSFFGLRCPASYGRSSPTIVGDHTTIELAALAAIGGHPAHNTDDYLTSKRLLQRGYDGVYLHNRIIAEGLGPEDWPAFFTQQENWAYGSMDLRIREIVSHPRGLSLSQFLLYFSYGSVYVHSLVQFAGMLVCSFLLITGLSPKSLNKAVVLTLLPMFITYLLTERWAQKFYPALNQPRKAFVQWQKIVTGFAAWPYVARGTLRALFGLELRRLITPKQRNNGWRTKTYSMHILMALVLFVALTTSIFRDVPASIILQLHALYLMLLNATVVAVAWNLWRSERRNSRDQQAA